MMTVPEAARLVGRNPETIRRWIRSGRLAARKVGTQHVIEETDLHAAINEDELLPVPWPRVMADGRPMPNVVELIRRSREGR